MRVLLTGGPACDKSSYAERPAASLPGPRTGRVRRHTVGGGTSGGAKLIAVTKDVRGDMGGCSESTLRHVDTLGGLNIARKGTGRLCALPAQRAKKLLQMPQPAQKRHLL